MSKWFIHLVPLLLIALVVGLGIGYFLVSKGFVENPAPSILKIPTEGRVDLAADYRNPLDKSSQYVNPFSEFKNPFDVLK